MNFILINFDFILWQPSKVRRTKKKRNGGGIFLFGGMISKETTAQATYLIAKHAQIHMFFIIRLLLICVQTFSRSQYFLQYFALCRDTIFYPTAQISFFKHPHHSLLIYIAICGHTSTLIVALIPCKILLLVQSNIEDVEIGWHFLTL